MVCVYMLLDRGRSTPRPLPGMRTCEGNGVPPGAAAGTPPQGRLSPTRTENRERDHVVSSTRGAVTMRDRSLLGRATTTEPGV